MGEESNGIADANLPKLKFPFLPLIDRGMADASPERPLHARASIPFKWEEQPGKPRPCTEIVVRPEPVGLSLELPPCRKHRQQQGAFSEDRITKMPSPTAVLDGPYKVGRSKFSSLRLFVREGVQDTVLERSGSSETTMEGYMGKKSRVRRLFGKFQRGGSWKEGRGSGGSFGFSPPSRFSPFSTTCCDCEEGIANSRDVAADGKMKRNGSFSEGSSSHGYINSSSSHLMGSIYKCLKQAIPRKMSRKTSKEV